MNSNRDVKLSAFLAVYFYTIENKLNESDNKLKSLKFQSEESNTDEFLKRYFQEFLLKNKDIKKATLKSISIESGKKKYHFSIKDLFSFSIKKVLLPEQLSKKQKLEISKTKKSVFTNPDLYLEINDGKQSYFESVELKSTKNNKMRGSSVQQVVPFEWVIFIKRNKENVNVTTGHYNVL